MMLYKEPQDMDVLQPTTHDLWVYKQGIASLGHNQYTMILFIQASEHPSGGTRFGENCITIKPASGLSILFSEESQVVGGLPGIPQVCGCMDKV